MKKIIVTTLILVFAFTSYCQQSEFSKSLTREEYLSKSKTQKLCGFILLGAGAITLISISGGNTDLSSVGAFAVAGGLATLGSIPLFISAGKNKRKAMASTSFILEKKLFISQSGISFNSLPSVSLKINL